MHGNAHSLSHTHNYPNRSTPTQMHWIWDTSHSSACTVSEHFPRVFFHSSKFLALYAIKDSYFKTLWQQGKQINPLTPQPKMVVFSIHILACVGTLVCVCPTGLLQSSSTAPDAKQTSQWYKQWNKKPKTPKIHVLNSNFIFWNTRMLKLQQVVCVLVQKALYMYRKTTAGCYNVLFQPFFLL